MGHSGQVALAVRSAGCDSVRKVWLVQVRGCAGWRRRKGVVFGRDVGAGGGEAGEKAVGLQAGRIVGRGAGAGGEAGSQGLHCLNELPCWDADEFFVEETCSFNPSIEKSHAMDIQIRHPLLKFVPLSRIIVTSRTSLGSSLLQNYASMTCCARIT